MRGARLEALDEGDLLGEHRLLALELGLLLLLRQRPLLLIEGVIARIGRELPAVDLDDLRDDAVHELAIVRGQHQRALEALEEGFEPDQALEVEVVARLVEQHHVGPHQEDPGQRDAHLPAAGELADVAIHHFGAEAEAGQHLAGAAVEGVAVELLEARLHVAVARDQRLHLVGARGIRQRGLQRRELGRHGAHRPGAIHRLGDGAAAGHVADILAEIANGGAAIDGDLPLLGRLLAGDEAEERGLAGTVRPDEADLLTTLQRGRRLDEDDLVAVLLGNVFEPDHARALRVSGTAVNDRPSPAAAEQPAGRIDCHGWIRFSRSFAPVALADARSSVQSSGGWPRLSICETSHRRRSATRRPATNPRH